MAGENATTEYYVSLNTKGLENSVAASVKQLHGMFDAIKADTTAIRELENQQKALRSANLVDAAAFKSVTEAIVAKKNSLGEAQTRAIELAGGVNEAATAATDYKRALSKTALAAKEAATQQESMRTGLQKLAADAKNVGGPAGALAGRFENLTKLFGSAELRTIAVAGGIAAIGIGAVAAAKGLFDFATGAADARLEESLLLQNSASLNDTWTDFAGAGAAAQAAIDNVARSSAASRSTISELGADLLKAGLSGSELETALAAASTVAVVQGKGAAEAFIKQAAAVKGVAGGVDALAAKTQNKLGPLAEAAFLTAAVQALKLQENIAGLFAGIDNSGLNEARAAVVALFDKTTVAGAAMRDMLEGVSQSLVGLATDFTLGLRDGILRALIFTTDLQIGFTELQIGLLDLQLGFQDAFPGGWWQGLKDSKVGLLSLGSGVFGVGLAMVTGGFKVAAWAKSVGGLRGVMTLATTDLMGWAKSITVSAVGAIKQGVTALAVWGESLWASAAAGWAAQAPLIPITAAIIGVGAAVYSLVKYWDELVEAFSDTKLLGDAFSAMFSDWVEFGYGMVEGIIEGFLGQGFDKAVAAVKKLGSGIAHAFKELLGIHSPSAVFENLAEQIPAGVVAGIRGGKRDVDSAIGGLITLPDIGKVGGARGSLTVAAGSASSGLAVTVNNYFQAGTPQETSNAVEQAVVRAITTAARQMGAVGA